MHARALKVCSYIFKWWAVNIIIESNGECDMKTCCKRGRDLNISACQIVYVAIEWCHFPARKINYIYTHIALIHNQYIGVCSYELYINSHQCFLYHLCSLSNWVKAIYHIFRDISSGSISNWSNRHALPRTPTRNNDLIKRCTHAARGADLRFNPRHINAMLPQSARLVQRRIKRECTSRNEKGNYICYTPRIVFAAFAISEHLANVSTVVYIDLFESARTQLRVMHSTIYTFSIKWW